MLLSLLKKEQILRGQELGREFSSTVLYSLVMKPTIFRVLWFGAKNNEDKVYQHYPLYMPEIEAPHPSEAER